MKRNMTLFWGGGEARDLKVLQGLGHRELAYVSIYVFVKLQMDALTSCIINFVARKKVFLTLIQSSRFRINYDVACPMNFRKYPYDTQTCKVKYESCKLCFSTDFSYILIYL